MKRLLIICAAIMLLLMSCGDNNKAVSGYIVGKRYTPAHTTRHYNAATHVYSTTHYSESWYLWIADSTDVRCIRVDKETFESAVKGDTINFRDGEETN